MLFLLPEWKKQSLATIHAIVAVLVTFKWLISPDTTDELQLLHNVKRILPLLALIGARLHDYNLLFIKIQIIFSYTRKRYNKSHVTRVIS